MYSCASELIDSATTVHTVTHPSLPYALHLPYTAGCVVSSQWSVSSGSLDSVSVLPLVKEAQNQHGLRHGDYRSYRCGERERRGGEGERKGGRMA